MAIGAKLSNLINSRNTNVNQLAAATGVSPSTIYSIIKRDNMKVDLDDLQKIADELCVTLDYFANADDIPPEPPRSVLVNELLEIFESLPIEGQTRILGYAERLLDEQEKRPRGL